MKTCFDAMQCIVYCIFGHFHLIWNTISGRKKGNRSLGLRGMITSIIPFFLFHPFFIPTPTTRISHQGLHPHSFSISTVFSLFSHHLTWRRCLLIFGGGAYSLEVEVQSHSIGKTPWSMSPSPRYENRPSDMSSEPEAHPGPKGVSSEVLISPSNER